jgi:hypothetical protein
MALETSWELFLLMEGREFGLQDPVPPNIKIF